MFKKKSPVKKKFATLPSSKKKRRQLDPRTVILIKQGFFGLALILVVTLIGTILWYGTRVEFLTIKTISIEGGETINHEMVKQEVEHLLEGEYVGIVPKRFAWWYPEEEILNRVSQVPRVKDPHIERVSGTEIKVSFSEYIPHALWCKNKDDDECYFIDEHGYSFVKAPKLTGGALPRFHTIGTEPAERIPMIPEADLKAVETLRTLIGERLSLPIAYVETDIMRDIFMGVAGGGEIKATLRMSPEETFSNLETIVSSKEFNDIKPGSFQYIDLRFGNKVFVNETTELATSTMASSTSIENSQADPLVSEVVSSTTNEVR